MKKGIDWAILVFGLIGLCLIMLRAVIGVSSLGPVPLDVNYIAIALVVMYTFLSGTKLTLEGKKQLGLYMMFFSVLIVALVIVSLTLQYKMSDKLLGVSYNW